MLLITPPFIKYDEVQSFLINDKTQSTMGQENEDELRQAQGPNYLVMLLSLAASGFSLFILFLWVRWLYNTGSPKNN